jgi:hypothetical protein
VVLLNRWSNQEKSGTSKYAPKSAMATMLSRSNLVERILMAQDITCELQLSEETISAIDITGFHIQRRLAGTINVM